MASPTENPYPEEAKNVANCEYEVVITLEYPGAFDIPILQFASVGLHVYIDHPFCHWTERLPLTSSRCPGDVVLTHTFVPLSKSVPIPILVGEVQRAV